MVHLASVASSPSRVNSLVKGTVHTVTLSNFACALPLANTPTIVAMRPRMLIHVHISYSWYILALVYVLSAVINKVKVGLVITAYDVSARVSRVQSSCVNI